VLKWIPASPGSSVASGGIVEIGNIVRAGSTVTAGATVDAGCILDAGGRELGAITVLAGLSVSTGGIVAIGRAVAAGMSVPTGATVGCGGTVDGESMTPGGRELREGDGHGVGSPMENPFVPSKPRVPDKCSDELNLTEDSTPLDFVTLILSLRETLLLILLDTVITRENSALPDTFRNGVALQKMLSSNRELSLKISLLPSLSDLLISSVLEAPTERPK
jgi:hypothetical protein